MNASKVTPMVQQYLSIKAEHPDAILFFRMGDFYEMFFEDAEKASKALDITLTSRNKNDPNPVLMCGVPHHSANSYVARLVEQGFKVAVCDQVQDPSEAKGLVERRVTQVVTPGMQLDGQYMDASQNNYLCAVAPGKKGVGLAFLDISTASFRVTETASPEAALQEIARMGPKEMVLPAAMEESGEGAVLFRGISHLPLSRLETRDFEHARARERLLEHFGTFSLEGFGMGHMRPGVRAAGALLYYVHQSQKRDIPHITHIRPYTQDQFMLLDGNTTRNLELVKNLRTGARQGSLLSILDKTVTAMGARLLGHILRYPLIDPEAINLRLDAVGQTRDLARVREQARELLKNVHDLERLRSRVALGHANGRDLAAMGDSLRQLPQLWSLIRENFTSPLLCGEAAEDSLADVADLIERSIREDAPAGVKDGGIIKPGFDQELDELVAMSTDVKGLIAGLEATEKEKTGLSNLKVRFNKVFGYYIELPKSQAVHAPPHYVRKQTLVNAERFITDELKDFETRVLGAEERRMTLEFTLFTRVRDRVNGENKRLEKAAELLAWVDVLAALGHAADHNGYCRPRVNRGQTLMIEDGRHPVVEKMISGQRFVPNSILLNNEDQQILMITGPNMAGKSTVLRQAALTAIMAQMGSFVPAEKAEVGVIDKIFTRVGALDNLSQGESTFMVEMQETANILNNATHRSLVILDEIGRGTSTFDGLSIAWAVAEHLHDLHGHGVKTLFATHYHELTDLVKTHPRVKNFNIAVNEWNDEIIFLHTLVEGGTNKSYGIQVARLAGIPGSVVKRAKEVLRSIEDSEEARVIYSARMAEKGPKKKQQVQLTLFPTPAELAAKALEKLDLNAMTPLEAMNALNDLQQRIKAPGASRTGEDPDKQEAATQEP